MKNKIVTLLLISLLSGITACKQTDPGNAAPDIPALSTMQMSFDQFPTDNAGISSQSTLSAQSINTQAVTYQNFIQATAQVTVWSTLLKIGLAVPVAAFTESFRHPADLRADNVWVWSYAVTINGVIHTVELHASVSDELVDWELYVTKPGSYLDFNWISGSSKRDGSGGNWLLRESPEAPQPLLDIQWTRDTQYRIAQVTYTNVRPGDAENGAYISYGVNDNTDYNVFFDIYQKAAGNLIEIDWHRLAHNGRIKNPAFFGDMDFHYWNALLQDVAAP